MKFNYLFKATPLLSTLLLILILSISNNKENTKLKILYWNTPSFAIDKYLAISTGSGFIISYFITNKLAKELQPQAKNSLNFKEEFKSKENNDEYIDTNITTSYDNILIERNIKDPLPTINANFRIIGRNNSNQWNSMDNNNYDQHYDDEEPAEQYEDQTYRNENNNKVNSISSDWSDDSFLSW